MDFSPDFSGLEIDDKGTTPSLRRSNVIEWDVKGMDSAKILSFEIALGTTAGGTDVVGWTDIGLTNSYTFSQPLAPSTRYYVGLR